MKKINSYFCYNSILSKKLKQTNIMSTKIGEEDELRKKVWKIINLIQANQLFVHSKNLEIKYLDEKSKKNRSF